MFGMALVMKEYKSPDPLKIGLLCANGVVFLADYFADLVEKSHGVPLPLILVSPIAPVTDQNTNRAQELQLEITPMNSENAPYSRKANISVFLIHNI
jgi:hypothetical protein